MTNSQIRRTMKERAIEIEESGEYQDAKDEAFNDEFIDFISDLLEDDKYIITYDDVQGFLDSFEFPSEEEYISNRVNSELDDYNDQKYQEWKERDI